LTAAVQGAFFGSSLPSAQIEALIAAHVPRKEVAEVADVYGTRWWDYRRLAPGHSFYLFAHHYYRATKVAARRMVSEKAAERGLTGGGKKSFAIYGAALVEQSADGIFERDKAEVTGMWKAMLVADALGMPYGEFCRLACRLAFEKLWKRLPRPSQLYSEKLGVFVEDEWHELLKGRLYLASHPVYAEENYAGLELQDQYRSWAIEHVKAQSSPIVGMSELVYVRKQVPEAIAVQHFPAQALKRARLLTV
jgi:hypothetical protein